MSREANVARTSSLGLCVGTAPSRCPRPWVGRLGAYRRAESNPHERVCRHVVESVAPVKLHFNKIFRNFRLSAIGGLRTGKMLFLPTPPAARGGGAVVVRP